MKITKCSIQKNNQEKVNIYLDDKYSFSMSLNTFIEHGLREGLELAESEVETLKNEDAPKLAFIKIADYLSYGPRTEAEMRKKLKEKEFGDSAIDIAITKAKGYNLINDEDYVRQYIVSKAIPSKWGSQKIIANLYPKGISIEDIKNAITEYYPREEKYDNALSLAEKKLRNLNEEDNNKKKQKIYSYLAGRGFDYSIIKEVISRIFSDVEDEY